MPQETLEQNHRCPECNSVIDHLRYVADTTCYGWEGGTCTLEGEEWDYSDSETHETDYTGSTAYECPDCGHEIGLRDQWPDPSPTTVDEDEETVKEPPEVQGEETSDDIDSNRFNNRATVTIVTCPDCGWSRDADSAEKTIICARCDLEFETSENKQDY